MSTYGNGTITARNGSWQISLDLGRDPQTGQRRRQRLTVRGSKREAQQVLREALQKRDMGLVIPTGKITVGTWLTGWLVRHESEGRLGRKTHDNYRRILRRHLIPNLGHIYLRDLRPDHIADVKSRLISGDKSTASAPLAGATVHKVLGIVRKALAEAVKAGLIARNPADAVSSPSVKSTTERRCLTEEEITALVFAAGGTRYDAPIRFTLATGLREGEMLALSWKDIDLAAGAVDVRRTLCYIGKKVTFPAPKTDRSRRTVEVSAATVRLLSAHRVAQMEHRLRLGAVWHDNDLVFPSLLGKPWIPRPFYKAYRRIVDESGIEHPQTVNWHTLRHTAASQWLRHGVDVFSVSRRLGHASASFTMDTYAHLLKGQQREAAEALDYLLAQA